MIHNYRQLQKWDQWLSLNPLAEKILDAEAKALFNMTSSLMSKRIVLLGVKQQATLLQELTYNFQTIITPLRIQEYDSRFIEADFTKLPFFSGSVDMVVLPHILELVDNPRHVLLEACRIIKPEGYLLILGFNPRSLLGLSRMWIKKKNKLPMHRFLYPMTLINWLRLADFELQSKMTVYFRPLTQLGLLYQSMNFIEPVLQYCFPQYGSIYILMAKAKVIPLTPIKMNWKQSLSAVSMTTNVPGHIRLFSKF